jgi:hypothetical protein
VTKTVFVGVPPLTRRLTDFNPNYYSLLKPLASKVAPKISTRSGQSLPASLAKTIKKAPPAPSPRENRYNSREAIKERIQKLTRYDATKELITKVKMDELKVKVDELGTKLDKLNILNSSTGLPMPEKYDGARPFEDYLREFNRISTAHSWEPNRCTQILPIFLTSEAKAAYDCLTTAEKSDFVSLTNALAQRLSKGKDKGIVRRELSAKKQRKGETIAEFALAIKDLVLRAYPELPIETGNNPAKIQDAEKALKKFQDEMARDHFRAGVLPEIKEKILFMETPDTLQAAIAQAKQVEAITKSLNNDLVSSLETNEIINSIKAEVCAVKQLINEKGGQNRNVNQTQQFQPRRPVAPIRPLTRWPNITRNNWNDSQNNQFRQPNFRQPNFRQPSFRQPIRNWNQPFGGNRFPNPYNQQFPRNANFQRPVGPMRWSNGPPPRTSGPNYRVNAVTDNAKSRSGSVSPLFPFMTLMSLLVLSQCFGAAGQYQICPKEPNGILKEIPKAQHCVRPEKPKMEKHNITLYIPVSLPKRFPIYRCKTINMTSCTSIYFLHSQKLPTKTNWVEPMQPDECWNLIASPALQRRYQTRWQTNNAVVTKYNAIWGESCTSTINHIVEVGFAGWLKGKFITSWGHVGVSPLESMKPSDYFIDFSKKETFVWKVPDSSFTYTHESIGPMEATMIEQKVFIIKKLEYALIIDPNQTRSDVIGVPTRALRTDNEAFVVIHARGENFGRLKREVNNYESTTRRSAGTRTTEARRDAETRTTVSRKHNQRRTTVPLVISTTQAPLSVTKIEAQTKTQKVKIEAVTKTTTQKPTALTKATQSTVSTTLTDFITSPSTSATTRKMEITTGKKAYSSMSTTRPLWWIDVEVVTFQPNTAFQSTPNTFLNTILTKSTASPSTKSAITLAPLTSIKSSTSRIKLGTEATYSKMLSTSTKRPTVSTTTKLIVQPKMTTKKSIKSEKFIELKYRELTKLNEKTTSKPKAIVLQLNPPHVSFKKEYAPFQENAEMGIWESSTTIIAKRGININEMEKEVLRASQKQSEEWGLKNSDIHHQNARQNYILQIQAENKEEDEKEKWMKTCLDKNRHLEMANSIIRLNPIEGVRLLYGRDDLMAHLIPDRINNWIISLCTQIQAEEIHWSRKVGEKCYSQLPISVGEYILFVKPTSRDLVATSEEIDCAKMNNGSVFQNGTEKRILEELTGQNSFQIDPYSNRQNPLIIEKGSFFGSETERMERNLLDFARRMDLPPIQFSSRTVVSNSSEAINSLIKGVEKIVLDPSRAMAKAIERTAKTIENTNEALANFSEISKWLWPLLLIFFIVGALLFLLWKGRMYLFLFSQIFGKKRYIAAVQQEPTAPTMEELLNREAYILDYIPRVNMISTRRNRGCIVNIGLNGHSINALFDSGSSLTYCRHSTAVKCNLTVVRKMNLPIAKAANDTSLIFLGEVEANCAVGPFQKMVKFLVSADKDCPAEAIIGIDLMAEINRHNFTIGLNFEKGLLQVGSHQLSIVAAISIEEISPIVSIFETITLDPRSDTLAWGKADGIFTRDDTFITRPFTGRYPMLVVGKCLVQPITTGGKVPLRLLNIGNCPIKLFINTRIATLEKLNFDENSIATLNVDKAIDTDEFDPNYVPKEVRWHENLPSYPREDKIPLSTKINFDGSVLTDQANQKLS